MLALPHGMMGQTFQELLVRQPVKLGGLGLRSMVETSPVAFVGGVEMALPFLTGDGGICPMLEGVIGRVEGRNRWQQFLDGDTRTAREFCGAWGSVRREVASSCNFLSLELEGPMLAVVRAAGGDSVDGSTRREVTQQRENLRNKSLTKSSSIIRTGWLVQSQFFQISTNCLGHGSLRFLPLPQDWLDGCFWKQWRDISAFLLL